MLAQVSDKHTVVLVILNALIPLVQITLLTA
jgi:hypothetical protein